MFLKDNESVQAHGSAYNWPVRAALLLENNQSIKHNCFIYLFIYFM